MNDETGIRIFAVGKQHRTTREAALFGTDREHAQCRRPEHAKRRDTFQQGDIIVERIGDGSAALSSGGNAVFLDEYKPDGTFVQTISSFAPLIHALPVPATRMPKAIPVASAGTSRTTS